jgi:hypothetical protein
MSRNINSQASLITSVAAADVAISGGELTVKGVGTLNVRKIVRAERIGAYSGSNVETNTITVNTAIGSAIYSGSITQVVEGETYTWPFSYTAPSGSPTASTIAAGVTAKIQEGIDGNQILGTVSNPPGAPTTIAFVGNSTAPVAFVTVSALMSNAKTYTVSWTAATSTYTTSTSVLTNFSGLVTGDVYRVYLGTGATGTDPKFFNGQTVVGRAASSSTMVLYGIENTGAGTVITTTTTGLVVLPVAKETFSDLLVGEESTFVAGTPYVGYEIDFESTPDLDAGVQIPQSILFSATETNALAFDRALIAALNGSSSFNVLNTFVA